MEANQVYLEEFNRLARTTRPTITEEQVKELRQEVTRVFESQANRRNMLRRDLSEMAAVIAKSVRMPHLMESSEGLTVLAKVVGDVVSGMVLEALKESTNNRR